MASTRRLAAILAADLFGYSRLMGDDEEGTLRRLKRVQAELLDPKFAEHGGRLVKTTGDGFLVEFGSVIGALRCASEIQAGMTAQAAVPEPRRLMFRIGIHQGDIVVEDDDIFGNGVNIAARLEGIAEPGGICVSARVQEDAVGRVDLDFEDIGEQQLKNIARPVRVFRVRSGGAHDGEVQADDTSSSSEAILADAAPLASGREVGRLSAPEPIATPDQPAPELASQPAATLEEAILTRLGHKAEIIQAPGGWLPLSRERQTALPVDGRNPGARNQLGIDATLGPRIPSPVTRTILRIGPLDSAAFADLLPDQPGMQSLVSLVRGYLGADAEFVVRPILAEPGPTSLQLAADPCSGPRLGWNTWTYRAEPSIRLACGGGALFPIAAATVQHNPEPGDARLTVAK